MRTYIPKLTFTALILICFAFKPQGDWYDLIYPVKTKLAFYKSSPQAKLKQAVLNIERSKGDSDIKITDIDAVTFLREINLKNMGVIEIFNVKLSDQLPGVYDSKNEILLADNAKHRLYLLALNSVEPIKTSQSDTSFYFAGRKRDRSGYSVFKIFNFSKGALRTIFTSSDAVSNGSTDCISYAHEHLKLNNTDLNNDGYLDLHFYGVENFYCNGKETYGWEDRKPLRSKKIKFTYYFNPKTNNWHK